MTILSRDQILQADDLGLVELKIPEWGGSVYVRVMRGTERDQFEARMTSGDSEKLSNVRAYLAALTVVDAKGERMFRSTEDIEALGGKSARALTRIFNKALEVNGFGSDDVEKLEKN